MNRLYIIRSYSSIIYEHDINNYACVPCRISTSRLFCSQTSRNFLTPHPCHVPPTHVYVVRFTRLISILGERENTETYMNITAVSLFTWTEYKIVHICKESPRISNFCWTNLRRIFITDRVNGRRFPWFFDLFVTKIPVLPTSCAYPPVPRFPLPSLFFLPPSNSESIVCPSSLVTSHITIISQFVHARHLHQESQSITMVSAHDAYRFSLSIVRNWHCNGYDCIGLFPTFSSEGGGWGPLDCAAWIIHIFCSLYLSIAWLSIPP